MSKVLFMNSYKKHPHVKMFISFLVDLRPKNWKAKRKRRYIRKPLTPINLKITLQNITFLFYFLQNLLLNIYYSTIIWFKYHSLRRKILALDRNYLDKVIIFNMHFAGLLVWVKIFFHIKDNIYIQEYTFDCLIFMFKRFFHPYTIIILVFLQICLSWIIEFYMACFYREENDVDDSNGEIKRKCAKIVFNRTGPYFQIGV